MYARKRLHTFDAAGVVTAKRKEKKKKEKKKRFHQDLNSVSWD